MPVQHSTTSNTTNNNRVPPTGGLGAPSQHSQLHSGCSSDVRNFGGETHITAMHEHSIRTHMQHTHLPHAHSTPCTHSMRVRAKRSIDSKLHRFARRAQLRAQRRKQYKSWQFALMSQSDDSSFTARHSQSQYYHSHHCNTFATNATSNTSSSNAEAGEVGEPLMHTQSPKALVTKFPILDSPTPPKEIHSTTTHTAHHSLPQSTQHPSMSTPNSPHIKRTTQSNTHARHHTLIHRGPNNFMRQHFKTTNKHPQNNSTQPLPTQSSNYSNRTTSHQRRATTAKTHQSTMASHP